MTPRKKPEDKLKAGRPTKYSEEIFPKIKELAGLGATDLQMAICLGVDETTFHDWKHAHPEFPKFLKAAKDEYDSQVVKSLRERAMGYRHKSEKIFCHEGQIIRAETIEQYPPDSTAMIFWLKNRQPKDWRDRQEVEIGLGDDLSKALQEARDRVAKDK